MKNKLILLLFICFSLTGCGFSSGLYDDILDAQELITEQKFDKAVKIYEKILLKKPSKTIKIKVNFQLGEIYSIYLNDFQKSIKNFNEIVHESNEPLWQIKALEKLGNIYFNNLKDYEQSIQSYLKLKNFYPPLEKNNFYTYRYGLSMFFNKEYHQAIEIFEELAKKNDQKFSVLSYYYIGLAKFYLKDYENAVQSWFEYISREKRKDLIVETKFLIANAYESSEKLKEAYNIYYSILGEYPNTEIIKNRLNSLYKRRVARKR